MFVVELANKRAGIALSIDFITINSEIHLWEFTLGTADILFDEFI